MNRTYSDAVAALNSLQSNYVVVDAIRKSGRGMNKQAIPEMIDWCRRVGYEPRDFDSIRPIHIAGTKGKGSTAAFVSSILSQYLDDSSSSSGQQQRPLLRKIGLYTSPHLRSVRERIQINNSPLSEDNFARYFFSTWDRLENYACQVGLPTDSSAKPVYFRFLTLMALHTYVQEGVDTAIIEAGIGGEYDSTNILVHPTVTAITNLGIDHVAMLGDTIGDIAWQKSGIMKPGVPVYTCPQPEGAMEILQQRADEKAVKLTVVQRHPALEQITLGLAADFQKTNASLAIAVAAAHLRALEFGPDIPEDHIIADSALPEQFRRGLEQVQWGGRCEIRREGSITWYIDGGHTLESIKVASQWYAKELRRSSMAAQSPRKRRVLVFNQQTRDAVALARALHRTLLEAIQGEEEEEEEEEEEFQNGEIVGQRHRHHPFTHVIFCSNVTFKNRAYKADLVSLNDSNQDVEQLTVQRSLAEAWPQIEADALCQESLAERRVEDWQHQHANMKTTVQILPTIEDAVEFIHGLALFDQDPKYGRERPREEVDRLDGGKVSVFVTGSLHLVGGLLEVLASKNSHVPPSPE